MYKAIKVVNLVIMIFGLILIVNAGRGLTGYLISGEDAYLSLTSGGGMVLISVLIYLFILAGEKGKNKEKDKDKKMQKKEIASINLPDSLKDAEERFVQAYARKPTKPELNRFVELENKSGKKR